MKYSYNWLKELTDAKLSPEHLKDVLMMHSFEVEGMEKRGEELSNVIVGKILEIKKHPNADKLQLVKVDVGNKKLAIVCGAKNIAVGQKVPVALVGAVLPNSLEIKEMLIRGEKSMGMLCAEDELGLGESHEGIMILDSGAKVGMELAKLLELEDAVLEIDVLANRAHDALSYVGMAREISANQKRKLDYDYDDLKLPRAKKDQIKVELKGKNLCPRYIAVTLENIEVSDSPLWVKRKLISSGLNSINNVVDTTNLIMLELGQPLHAFDADEVKGKIVVRSAKKGEKIELLDGKVKELQEGDIVIADSKRILGLAGIMGGKNSGITKKTKRIILEAANFNASSIRKTRLRLGLMTDASMRFEKDIDPNLTEKAAVRAIEILEHIAKAELKGITDVYPKPVKPWKIKLSIEYAVRLLGENIAPREMIKILNLLGIKAKILGYSIQAEIPTFRIDLKAPEDLIEEIGRIYGYEKIEPTPLLSSIEAVTLSPERMMRRKARRNLAGLGFDEIYSYSFYSEKDSKNAGLGGIKHLELANPMNPNQNFMRVSLVPNLLKAVRENLKNLDAFNIFEIGRVYWPNSGSLPEEKEILTLAVVLEQDKKEETFWRAKGKTEEFLRSLGFDNFYFDTLEGTPKNTMLGLWYPLRRAEIKLEGDEESVGFFGEINPSILNLFKIKKRVVMAEFDMEKLKDLCRNGDKCFTASRKYPAVTRDISLVVQENLTARRILKSIRQSASELLLNVELFDVFKKDGQSSCAFRITLGASDRTLNGKEVDELMDKIVYDLEKIGVQIRK